MSVFDDIKGKAAELAEDKEDQIKGGIEKVGDFVDDKTGGKFEKAVDNAQNAASHFVDGVKKSDPNS